MKVRLLWWEHNRPGARQHPDPWNYYKYYTSSNNSLQSNGNKKFDRKDLTLSLEQKDAIIGILLSDGFLEKRKPNHNARLRIDHAYPAQSSYVNHLYDLLKNLSGKNPNINTRKPDKRTNKVYSSIAFKTYNLPCLNEFHTLFYKDSGLTHVNGQVRYIKVIPLNIQQLLTPLSLSHLVMGDGFFTLDKTIILCTESFTKDQIELLINALKMKFDITAGIHKRVSSSGSIGWRIRISKKSIEKFIGHSPFN